MDVLVVNESPYDTLVQTKLLAKGKHTNWAISAFRDYVVDYDQPLFTSEWNQISSDYFIDKVPNSNIDFNKSPYELGKLTDNFLVARLFFNPTENYKISTNALLSINKSK